MFPENIIFSFRVFTDVWFFFMKNDGGSGKKENANKNVISKAIATFGVV